MTQTTSQQQLSFVKTATAFTVICLGALLLSSVGVPALFVLPLTITLLALSVFAFLKKGLTSPTHPKEEQSTPQEPEPVPQVAFDSSKLTCAQNETTALLYETEEASDLLTQKINKIERFPILQRLGPVHKTISTAKCDLNQAIDCIALVSSDEFEKSVLESMQQTRILLEKTKQQLAFVDTHIIPALEQAFSAKHGLDQTFKQIIEERDQSRILLYGQDLQQAQEKVAMAVAEAKAALNEATSENNESKKESIQKHVHQAVTLATEVSDLTQTVFAQPGVAEEAVPDASTTPTPR